MSNSLTIRVDQMKYPSGDILIDGLQLDVPPGHFLSLMGPSGCGKSTLLRIIAGLETSYEGEVRLGRELVRAPGKQIQMMFQEHHLFPWLTALENVSFARDEPWSENAIDGATKLISQFGMEQRMNAWPSQLSGGEQSRVALARALLASPEALLLDEPFRSLDLETRSAIIMQLDQALSQRKTTSVMVSHDIEDALLLSDTIVLLGTRPARAVARFTLSTPRPRARSDDEVRRVGLEILKAMSSAQTR